MYYLRGIIDKVFFAIKVPIFNQNQHPKSNIQHQTSNIVNSTFPPFLYYLYFKARKTIFITNLPAMRKSFFSTILISVIFIILISQVHSCKKSSKLETVPLFMAVLPAKLELKHDLYYRLKHQERSIELDFSEQLDSTTVDNINSLYDNKGPLDNQYVVHITGRKVLLMFKPEFQLRDGWKYLLSVKAGIRSVTGLALREDITFELRTLAHHPPETSGDASDGQADNQRNSIACISDIHMGEARAVSGNYCWFGQNADALEDFLDFVISGNQVRELVILGDLFDEWLIPYSISPFDSSQNVSDTREYFISVANAPVNLPIIKKLKEIALHQDIRLVYVPGNHDMLSTNEILDEIIPNAHWAGDVEGLGKYSPVGNIIMEHGHRYDFFNCPQPLVNPGHMLPPGFFISRLYAQGLMDRNQQLLRGANDIGSSFEFIAAWEVAMLYTLLHLDMEVPDMNAENILMGGIDGYTNPFSFNGAQDMYSANIEDNWDATQTQNEVPAHMDCCLTTIWNGHSDLFIAAQEQYLEQPPSPKTYKIVAFGHTHDPLVEVYPSGSDYTGIYINSGSWIDADQSSYPVRTYLIINPAEWTGSDLDVASLYQYNLDDSSGEPAYKPVLIKEENIDVSGE